MKQDILQAPWTALECKSKQDRVEVDVWGRKYIWENSLFPSIIQTAGESILVSPIKLRAFFDGEEQEMCDTQYLDIESDDAGCEFTVAQSAGNVVFNGRIRVEYDGMMHVKFCVVPFWNAEYMPVEKREKSEYCLNKLFIDIPVKKEYARLYHYNPGGTSTIRIHKNIPSGLLPEEGIKIPYKMYSWLGWEDGGLSIFSESDENLELQDKERAIEYIVNEDTVIYRIHLLDHLPKAWQGRQERWISAAVPIQYEYGIQATPVKPFEKNKLTDFQIFHMDNTAKEHKFLYKEFEESEEKGREFIRSIAEKGAKYFLILGWTKIMNHWEPTDDEQFRKFVDICHEYGLEPMLYFGYEYSTVMTDWYENADKYLQKTTDGRYTDGWLMKPPHPWQRAYTFCLNGEYADVFYEGILSTVDKYGIKAIYFDGTYNAWECANEAHGCGYRDADGNLCNTYPFFAVREFAKKIYKAMHDRNGITMVHQSGTCTVPTMAFCDISFTGENIQRQIMEQRCKYLGFDGFRAETGINTGVNVQFIAQIEENFEENISTFAAITLPHGVMPLPRNNREVLLNYMSKIWAVHHEFGIDEAEWKPYWKDCPVSANVEGVYVSVYEKPDAYLAVASNINDDAANVRLSVNGTITYVENMITKSVYPHADSYFDIELEPYKVMLINIRK